MYLNSRKSTCGIKVSIYSNTAINHDVKQMMMINDATLFNKLHKVLNFTCYTVHMHNDIKFQLYILHSPHVPVSQVTNVLMTQWAASKFCVHSMIDMYRYIQSICTQFTRWRWIAWSSVCKLCAVVRITVSGFTVSVKIFHCNLQQIQQHCNSATFDMNGTRESLRRSPDNCQDRFTVSVKYSTVILIINFSSTLTVPHSAGMVWMVHVNHSDAALTRLSGSTVSGHLAIQQQQSGGRHRS